MSVSLCLDVTVTRTAASAGERCAEKTSVPSSPFGHFSGHSLNALAPPAWQPRHQHG